MARVWLASSELSARASHRNGEEDHLAQPRCRHAGGCTAQTYPGEHPWAQGQTVAEMRLLPRVQVVPAAGALCPIYERKVALRAGDRLMSGLYIIVNADDLGYDEGVNSEIERFAENSLISSVSVLSNGNGFDGAMRVVNRFPHLSVGIHLNVTEFESLSKSPCFQDCDITDAKNFFTGKIKYRPHIKPGFNKSILEAIYLEWDLQIRRLVENGITLSHMDSHNMVHYWRELFPIVKRLQEKYGIKVLRMKDVKPLGFYGIFNKNLARKTPPVLKELSNLIWNLRVRYVYPKTKLVNHVFSYKSLCFYLSTGSVCPKAGVFEVVVHPGLKYMDYFDK
ncbi:MAG: ChbG/HpnK family deacetylase, partial [Verrucomicrobiae bacterium]|nr:ChbG/HpnK family deacetylase [Verrucomicrobiae bacterium]